MKLFKDIIKLKKRLAPTTFFGSSRFEIDNLICGIGESEILDTRIKITKYPFVPSSVFPEKVLNAEDIQAISWNAYPPLIRIGSEVIFVSREFSEQLKQFALRNSIETFEATQNWDYLLEPYLDNDYTGETDKRIIKLLASNGIYRDEIDSIRDEVKQQMLKYNFDTMLWEWAGLGLSDVLAAMRLKYNTKDFHEFYFRAMEIQLRSK